MWQVAGQDRVVSFLRSSLEKGKLGHAYLFVGPHHVGKMTLALDLARALNCAAAERPCDDCPACRRIAAGKHADVRVIDLNNAGANRAEIGIDQVRDMQHASSLPPFEGRCRVFIIDGAEYLSNEAANCMLKMLEEPGDRVVYLLLARSDRNILTTVISRCQLLELRPLPAAGVEAVLMSRWNVLPDKARLLARLSHGHPGWAVVAAATGDLLEQRSEEVEKLIEVVDGDIETRFSFAGHLATRFSEDRESVQDVLRLWLDWWHDVLSVRIGLGENITNIDFETALVRMARGYSLAEIRAVIGSIQSAAEQLRLNASPRLVMEVLMLDLPRLKETV